MRLIYIHQYFNRPDMSGGTRSYEFARRLVERGHSVALLTSDRGSRDPRWRREECEGIELHVVGVPYSSRMGPMRRMLAFASFAVLAAQRAASVSGDVVLASSTPLTVSLAGRWCASHLNIPFVFEVRDLWPEVPIALGVLRHRPAIALAEKMERDAYRASRRIIALSPAMAETIVAGGVESRKVVTIPNAADVASFAVDEEFGQDLRRNLPWLGERPLVLYAGALGRVNDLARLLDVAAQVKRLDEQVRFLLVGDGAESRSLRRRAEELGLLNESVFFLAALPKARMPELYSAASVVLSCFQDSVEMRKNSANKFFDGLAAGRPVAVHYGGWQAELLRESGAGIALDPVDAKRAARQLVELLRDSAAIRRMRTASARLASERFDRELLAQRFEGVLLDAIGRA